MKNITKSLMFLSLFFFIHCSSLLFAQYEEGFIKETVRDFNIGLKLNETSSYVDLSKVKGSPYENDTFELGKAIDKALNNSTPHYLR